MASTDEREVLLGLLDIVTRRAEINEAYVEDAKTRIRALPDERLPELRKAVLEARDALARAWYDGTLAQAVVDVVKGNLDIAGFVGMQKALGVGYVRAWVGDPDNDNAMRWAVSDAIAYVDSHSGGTERKS